jgi:hypothetical protein
MDLQREQNALISVLLKKTKTARFLPGGFSLYKSDRLFAAAEPP